MRYEFPVIETIDDVLPHIDEDHFVVAERDSYTVVNYRMLKDTTFPPIGGEDDVRNKVRRECRGMVFYPDGRIMSRRFHKFFNVGEREETLPGNVDLSEKHTVLEKLDGSFVTPLDIDGTVMMGTKMGLTDVALAADDWVMEYGNDDYTGFMELAIRCGLTPIFEFCTNRYRVVVDHPAERMVLLAIRSNVTGTYMNYDAMDRFMMKFFRGVEVVGVAHHAYQEGHRVNDLDAFSRWAAGQTDVGEGFVIRFEDGHMLKAKTEEYVRIHRTKDRIRQERNLVDVIVNGQLDDLVPFLMKDDLERIRKYEENFHLDLEEAIYEMEVTIERIIREGMNRKEFALGIGADMRKPLRSAIFSAWYDRGLLGYGVCEDKLTEFIRERTHNNRRFEEVRCLFPDCEWSHGVFTGTTEV